MIRDVDAHDLYGLPLERFIPERTALAKELRGRGERDQAGAVAKLPKPSLAAWAVNQLVRTQRRAVGALFKAGDGVQRAQAKLLSGRGDGGALRDALARERQAVHELVEVARGLLSAEGHELSPAMLERVADTLHAAALEEEARDEVAKGCLHRELRHIGLGAVTGQAPAGKRRRTRKGEGKAAPPSALRKAESNARRAAGRAARELESARARHATAAEALREAEAALDQAERRLSEAQAAHRQAERDLSAR